MKKSEDESHLNRYYQNSINNDLDIANEKLKNPENIATKLVDSRDHKGQCCKS